MTQISFTNRPTVSYFTTNYKSTNSSFLLESFRPQKPLSQVIFSKNFVLPNYVRLNSWCLPSFLPEKKFNESGRITETSLNKSWGTSPSVKPAEPIFVQGCGSSYFVNRLRQQKTTVDNFFYFCGSIACLLLHFIILRRQKPIHRLLLLYLLHLSLLFRTIVFVCS